MKNLLKIALWCVIGIAAVGFVTQKVQFHTPWTYTVSSVVTPGSFVTLTHADDGQPVHVEVKEPLAVTKTIDFGRYSYIAGTFVLGTFLGYALKRRKACNSINQVTSSFEVV